MTGGAGYIGRHVVQALLAAGHRAVVLDNLSNGDARTLPTTVPFVQGSVGNVATVNSMITRFRPAGVIHLAASKSVSESVRDPLSYYQENVVGTMTVLEAMVANRVRRIIFASSAAVYGNAVEGLVGETSVTEPVNPYGHTKLVAERLLREMVSSHGLTATSLRYFNVAGAATPRFRDQHAAGLVPRVIDTLLRGENPQLLVVQHPTPDGSCVRDFIHISDLADAHRKVAEAILQDRCGPVYNLGTGRGVSVLEVLRLVERITHLPVAPDTLAARIGDPPRVIASTDLIEHEIGWKAAHPVERIIRSEWQARFAAPAQRRSGPVTIPRQVRPVAS